MPWETNEILLEVLSTIPLIIVAVFLLAFFIALWKLFIGYRYTSSLKWTLLEIQVPTEVGVTPKAMEQVMAGIHGMVKNPTKIEEYIEGFVPHRFSLEIVGIDGNVHFLLRIQTGYVRLAKAQIYAQYPDAEINEVEDYAWAVPQDLPDKDWDLWGTELKQTGKSQCYPIRTYPNFIDELATEEQIDPLAAVSEVMSHLKKGEQIWVQIVCASTHKKWQEDCEKEVAKLAGKPAPKKKETLFDKVDNLFRYVAWEPRKLFGWDVPSQEKKEEYKPPSEMQHKTEGERATIKAIEDKASKFGFISKIRFIYLGKREVFDRANVPAFLGAWKQFATQDLNGFTPDSSVTTKIDYFMKEHREAKRKRRILMRYRYRSFSGINTYILNIEEMATLYHFPSGYVKAPTLARVEAKRGAAPPDLPINT